MALQRSLLMFMRLGVLFQLVVGIGLWTGQLSPMVDVHQTVGVLFVLSLWMIAIIAMAQGRMFGLAAFALVWGAVVAALGFTQQSLLPGDLHWIVRVLHLIIGVASVPIAEGLVPRPVRAPA
jgi:hypothetical protein